MGVLLSTAVPCGTVGPLFGLAVCLLALGADVRLNDVGLPGPAEPDGDVPPVPGDTRVRPVRVMA